MARAPDDDRETDDSGEKSARARTSETAEVLDQRGERPLEATDEPPVVARLMIEIRSDGSRTIARGAIEDLDAGQRVAIEAKGDSPMQLAWSLARSMWTLPSLARTAARGLLPGRRRRGRKP